MTAPALSHGREVVHPAATHKGAWAIWEYWQQNRRESGSASTHCSFMQLHKDAMVCCRQL